MIKDLSKQIVKLQEMDTGMRQIRGMKLVEKIAKCARKEAEYRMELDVMTQKRSLAAC